MGASRKCRLPIQSQAGVEPIVLHEDNHTLVVYKPAGILTQRDSSRKPSLMDWVKGYLKERYRKKGNVFLGLVHRLDQPVSGVLLFARTSKGASRLSEQVRNRELTKIYWAIVEGVPLLAEGQVRHHLVRTGSGNVVAVSRKTAEAKEAILRYRVLERGKVTSLLEITLETGRRHQIRAQLALLGCPILGDHRYGSAYPYQEGAIALVAKRIEYRHPTTGKRVRVELPESLCLGRADLK